MPEAMIGHSERHELASDFEMPVTVG